jgi:hypothetical protein
MRAQGESGSLENECYESSVTIAIVRARVHGQ